MFWETFLILFRQINSGKILFIHYSCGQIEKTNKEKILWQKLLTSES